MNSEMIQKLQDLANKLRIHSVQMTNASKSGHPTSCASMAELISVLFFHTMKYRIEEPKDPNSDRFVLSKGHTAPILYAAWAEAGLFPISELLNLRKFDSDLEGHPTPRLPFIDVASGSLGQGLGVSAGMAYMGKYIEKCPYKVYCLMGDGEISEGSVWEAAAFSSFYNLDNLVAIVDINRLGQNESTPIGHDIETYQKRWSAFGFETFAIDGHDINSIINAFEKANTVTNKPCVVLAKTFKGYGFKGISDQVGWHGKALGNSADSIIEDISSKIIHKAISGKDVFNPIKQAPPKILKHQDFDNKIFTLSSPPSYELGQKVATRAAYGVGLLKLGEKNKEIVVIDADVRNSTYTDKFKKQDPTRFIDCFIAEQNMISVGVGASTRDRSIVYATTFGAFLTRAFDQIRMAAISYSKINICGTHVGVSIGEDGGSQMALEDLAMFRSIPNSTVFYPSDAVSMERAVELSCNTKGISYIRASRPETPVIYKNDEVFKVGKAKVIAKSDNDNICLVGGGVTLFEIIKAADILSNVGLTSRIIDIFSIKPIDVETLLESARVCGGKMVVVEDHYIEGGIYEAVCSALASFCDISIKSIAISEIPHSGKPAELLEKYGISGAMIAEKIKTFKF